MLKYLKNSVRGTRLPKPVLYQAELYPDGPNPAGYLAFPEGAGKRRYDQNGTNRRQNAPPVAKTPEIVPNDVRGVFPEEAAPDPGTHTAAPAASGSGGTAEALVDTSNGQSYTNGTLRTTPVRVLTRRDHFVIENNGEGWFLTVFRQHGAHREFVGETRGEAMRASREWSDRGLPGFVAEAAA